MRITEQEAQQVLNVAGGFYDAATQSISWASALSRLNDLFDMSGVIFEQHDFSQNELLEFESDGLPEHALGEWAAHYYKVCPRLAHMKDRPAGSISVDYQFIDEAGILRDPLYQDFLRPNGTRYFLATTLEQDLERSTTLSIQRSERQGHASSRDADLLKILSPHLRRALELKRKTGLERRRVGDYQAAFQAMEMGVVLADDTGRVEFMNETAESFVAQAQAMSIRGRRLIFAGNDARSHYEKTLKALSDETLKCPGPMALQSDGAEGQPLRLDFMPLPASTQFSRFLDTNQAKRRRLLILVSDTARIAYPSAQLLRDVYGLTVAESDLALALCRGATLREHATMKGVAYTTVRSQLVSVRAKLGERDQAGVVRQVLRLLSPLDE